MIAIIGPKHSGKSRSAEALFTPGERKIYLATLPRTREFSARIERHRAARRWANWIDAEYSPDASPAEKLRDVLTAEANRDCRAVLVEGVSAMMARRVGFLAAQGRAGMTATKTVRDLVLDGVREVQAITDHGFKLVLVTGDDRSRDALPGGLSVANAVEEFMRDGPGFEYIPLGRDIRVIVNGLTSPSELAALEYHLRNHRAPSACASGGRRPLFRSSPADRR